MKAISEAVKKNIISLLRSGRSIRKISSTVGVSNSTVQRIRKKITKELPCKHLPCSPRLLSSQQERHLVRMVSSGQWSNASKAKLLLKSEYKINLKVNSIRSILKRNHLRSYIKKRKPLLRKSH